MADEEEEADEGEDPDRGPGPGSPDPVPDAVADVADDAEAEEVVVEEVGRGVGIKMFENVLFLIKCTKKCCN